MKPALGPMLLAALWAALLTLLTACGPGVGGTGTGLGVAAVAPEGDSVYVDYGAAELPADLDLVAWNVVPAPLCAAPIADALLCPLPGAPAGGPMLAAQGTQAVYFVDADTGNAITVAVASNTIAMAQGCPALTFSGVWATDDAGRGRFYGSTGTGTAAMSVTLTASPAALTVKLQDRAGRVLLGPVALRPAGGPTVPRRCP